MSNQFQISMVQVTLWRNIIFDAFLRFYLIDFILFLFLNNSDPFLVRWSPQRTLVPSFFFFYLSLLFPIFPFTCNFMWIIKLRASAGISGYVRGVRVARVCAGVRRCAQACMGVARCAHVCRMNFQNFFQRIESLHQRTLIRILYGFFHFTSRCN